LELIQTSRVARAAVAAPFSRQDQPYGNTTSIRIGPPDFWSAGGPEFALRFRTVERAHRNFEQ
jgi:hypothetical protein